MTAKAVSPHAQMAVTDEEDGASPRGKAPEDGEGQDSESSNSSEITDTAELKEDHDEETEGTSSETEESDSESNSSSLESDVEIPAQAVPPARDQRRCTNDRDQDGQPHLLSDTLTAQGQQQGHWRGVERSATQGCLAPGQELQ